MARTKSKHSAVCLNPNCAYFQKEAGKDMVKRGINTAGHQRFYCNHCNKYSVITKGTPLYNLKISEKKVKAICVEFAEGNGIREIERKLHIHRDTVGNILDVLGTHAKTLSNHLVHDLKLSEIEVDELFATIQKKEKSESERTQFPCGSQKVIATCVKRNSSFLVSHYIHNWDKNLLRGLFLDIKDRLLSPNLVNKLTIYSDGNDDYTTIIPEFYNLENINYGQKIKTENGEKVFPAIKRIVYGNVKLDEIETNTVESINSVLRDRISRLNRRTKKISKHKSALDSAMWLFKFSWNFIHKRHKHLMTPAMIEGISTKFWTWGMFLHTTLKYSN